MIPFFTSSYGVVSGMALAIDLIILEEVLFESVLLLLIGIQVASGSVELSLSLGRESQNAMRKGLGRCADLVLVKRPFLAFALSKR